jgi:hypothetical protein
VANRTHAHKRTQHVRRTQLAGTSQGCAWADHHRYCAALHYAALRCAALRCAALRCTALRRCAALRCAALHGAALRCTALRCCAALRCAALHSVLVGLRWQIDLRTLMPFEE